MIHCLAALISISNRNIFHFYHGPSQPFQPYQFKHTIVCNTVMKLDIEIFLAQIIL